MAKIEELIPFILYYETGGAKSCWKQLNGKRVYDPKAVSLEQQYNECAAHGFGNDPLDAGGATQCGVILETYKAYCRKKGYPVPTVTRLKNLPYSQWREIIKIMFWDRWQADRIQSQALANILVDFVWASGSYGITTPQRVLGVSADGVVGEKTLAALAARNPRELFNALHTARINFVDNIVQRKPSQVRFINGWKRRINAITFDGLKYV